jgi:hypothetical protein
MLSASVLSITRHLCSPAYFPLFSYILNGLAAHGGRWWPPHATNRHNSVLVARSGQ